MGVSPARQGQPITGSKALGGGQRVSLEKEEQGLHAFDFKPREGDINESKSGAPSPGRSSARRLGTGRGGGRPGAASAPHVPSSQGRAPRVY